MSKKIDKFVFGIRHNELSKYKADGIILENLPEGCIDKYSEETIVRAKELKAKHKDKYSDEYYLEMAEKLDIRDMLGGFLKIGKRALIHCEITDPKWAGYTYEEILQMEEDGFVVPKEILEWAHAKQQADETNYVILSETVDATVDTTLEDNVVPDDLNSLRTRSMQDIAKVEKAQTETKNLMEEYNLKAQGAKKIQEEKEDSYEDSMKEITSLAKEWKTLNDKQKNGTQLTNDEQHRLEELGKLLNVSDGKLTKEIQADNLELNNFLEGLDSLTEKVNYDLEIASQTIRNAMELSDWECKVSNSKMTVKEDFVKDKGFNFGKLKGLNVENISSVALTDGRNLNAFASEISSVLSGDNNIKLAHFATDYTNLATQTENFTKNTMGEAFDKVSEDNENSGKNEEYKIDSMDFTYQNAQKAVIVTEKAIVDTLFNRNQSIIVNKKQEENNEKSIKDIFKLNKETKVASEKHKEYVSEEEEFLKELEALQGQEVEGLTKEKVESIAEEPTISKSSNVVSQDDKSQKQTEVESSKQEIIANIKNIDDADKNAKGQIQKPLDTSVASTAKSEKNNKDLTSINNNLKRINNDLGTVSGQTLVIGVGTFAKSFITTAIGTYMSAKGISLMPNPATHRKGVEMNRNGILLQEQGFKENINGIMSSGVAEFGLTTSAMASESHSAAKDSIKEFASLVNANKKVFKETQEVLDIKSSIAVNENMQTDEQNSQESEQTGANAASNSNNDNIVQGNLETGEATTSKHEQIQTTNENSMDAVANQTPTMETLPQEADSKENLKEETSTSETNNTEKENNTEDTGTNGSENQPAEENTNDKDKTPGVSIEFSPENSLIATALTSASTINLTNEQSIIEKTKSSIEKETQNSQKIVKETEKQTAKVVAEHKTNEAEAETLGSQISTTQSKIQTTENAEEAESANAETENLNTQLETVKDKDSKVSQTANLAIKSGVQQIAKFQNNALNLGKDIKDFNSNIDNQLKISERTMVVGTGTAILGGLDLDAGTAMIATGTPLLADPFTEPEGLVLVAKGQELTNRGIIELVTGGVALAAGTTGVVANSSAQTVSLNASAVEKFANQQYKNSDKVLKDSTKALKDLGIDVEKGEKSDSKTQTKEEQSEQKEEEKDIVENETTMAASATTNASITNAIESDDKADRKLARFNEESIIESRKKRKKVVAISASSRNGR